MSAGLGPASGDPHPALLPWLAAGRLDGDEGAQVRRHLDECAECRREFDALLSMRETMQRHDRTDHVPTIDLVAYHEREFPAGDPRTATIEEHLRGCSACAEDLEALRRSQTVMESIGAAEAAAGRNDARRWKAGWIAPALAAAALVVVLARPLWRSTPPPAEAPAALQPLHSVTFAQPTRGEEPPLVLADAPPWAIRVLLPYGSPAGDYEVAVVGATGPLPGLHGRVRASEDGVVAILLNGLPAPGRYGLSLSPVGDPATAIDYPFEYRAPSPP
jgi:hypothetical protein